MAEFLPMRESPPVRPGRLATLLLLFGLGTVVYTVAVYMLLLLGFAKQGSGVGLGTWIIRDLTLAAIALGAVLMAAWLPPVTLAPSVREVQGSALTGAGAAWWFLGLADMHAFGVFTLGGGRPVWDLFFHGFGAMLILAGAVLCAAERNTSTPQRTDVLERSLSG